MLLQNTDGNIKNGMWNIHEEGRRRRRKKRGWEEATAGLKCKPTA
jgi:hypothetical protein